MDSPKLILAVRKSPFYQGLKYVRILIKILLHVMHFKLSFNVLLLLQGLYIGQYCNICEHRRFFKAVGKLLEHESLYLCVSYDTDLLAFEGIVPYASMDSFAAANKI